MTLLSVLWTLTLSGCFDDTVTVGLECENNLECGQGQACGPGVVDPNSDEPTPGQVCGVPQDEGWDACTSTERSTCVDFETVRSCVNGFWTATDCDALCEAADNGKLNDGLCGADDPDLNDCACGYVVDDTPAGAEDCVQFEGLEVVRSSFESDDAAVYLQTCDEWCEGDSGIPFEGSLCRQTFLDRVAETDPPAATAIGTRISDAPCVCRYPDEPDCEGQPLTRCVDTEPGTGLLELCGQNNKAQIQCPGGCGSDGAGMLAFDWCL